MRATFESTLPRFTGEQSFKKRGETRWKKRVNINRDEICKAVVYGVPPSQEHNVNILAPSTVISKAWNSAVSLEAFHCFHITSQFSSIFNFYLFTSYSILHLNYLYWDVLCKSSLCACLKSLGKFIFRHLNGAFYCSVKFVIALIEWWGKSSIFVNEVVFLRYV